MVDLGGRRLHLNCTGSGSPAVIVENGGGGFSMEWAVAQPEVAKQTRICTYDRAGYAWSDRGPVDDGIEQIVSDLNLLLRTAHVNAPYVLVGRSLGALYARAYQRRFPEQVAGLVFVDGTHEEEVRMVVNGKQEPLSLLKREQLPAAHQQYLESVPALNPGRAGAPLRSTGCPQPCNRRGSGRSKRPFGISAGCPIRSPQPNHGARNSPRLGGSDYPAGIPSGVFRSEFWSAQGTQPTVGTFNRFNWLLCPPREGSPEPKQAGI
jgi:hypothetical protein